ncbi:MAG TPA: hypothetical protein IAC15_07570 [Candidatus Onthomonas avicola]|nr:hypothetical protein [Candidatus Onthomonas avicola]
MSILDLLDEPAVWQRFLEDRMAAGHWSRTEQEDISTFVSREEYRDMVARIVRGASLPLPEKRLLSKMGTEKKRVVYQFPREMNYVLKLLTWLLGRYDGIFADNLWSFRRGRTARQAVRWLIARRGIERLYSYRMDVHDYFNSVDIHCLMSMLERIFAADQPLLDFCRRLLCSDEALQDGKVIRELKGIMAGVPVASFFADVYLMEMDAYFAARGVIYARYSDDVIVFAETEAEREEFAGLIGDFLRERHLTFNPDKVERTAPGERWSFLGISYCAGVVDVSPVSVRKLKGKLRRKARALLRWRERKGAPPEAAMRAYIRHFNRKLYENPVQSELTWCRWYFPLITTAQSLRELDRYMQQCIRYLATGRHTKANYNLRYETIRALGYRSLVSAYYAQLCRPDSVPERPG